MPTLDFFLGHWKISYATGHARIRNAFPNFAVLTIEELSAGTGKCRVFWTDSDRTLHDLRGITYSGGQLIGRLARDESSDLEWTVTISDDGTGTGLTGVTQLTALWEETDDDAESNLAGVWGADAHTP
jgi:hypothetical protein